MSTRVDGGASHVVLVGDVAGHLTVLDEVLEPFEVSVREAEVPNGTTVVQVGDLVGRSTEDEAMVAAADRVRRRHPGRWVQLIGNHELHHLGGHRFQGTGELSEDAVATMQSWLDEGWMRIAVALPVAEPEVLVCHAGLTRGLWSELGAPLRASEAAAALEALRRDGRGWDVINRPGRMLSLGRFPTTVIDAGPIWAEASVELAPPWIGHADLPFDQVHGHSSVYDWFRGRLRNLELVSDCELDRERRHVVVRAGEHTITGIDPGLGREAHDRWAPLVLPI